MLPFHLLIKISFSLKILFLLSFSTNIQQLIKIDSIFEKKKYPNYWLFEWHPIPFVSDNWSFIVINVWSSGTTTASLFATFIYFSNKTILFYIASHHYFFLFSGIAPNMAIATIRETITIGEVWLAPSRIVMSSGFFNNSSAQGYFPTYIYKKECLAFPFVCGTL